MLALNRFRMVTLGALLVITGTIGAVAHAARTGGDENDAMGVAQAKVSLVQAVTLAEQHLSGKASKAEYERTKAGFAYDIEVVSGDKVFDVRVDADKGVILSSALDTPDGKGEREEHDDKD